MHRILALTLAATLLAAPLAAEQQDGYGPALEPGTRVRLTSCYSALATACMKSAGTLASWRTDSVVLRPEGHEGPVGVPRAWVTRIEVSRGRQKTTGVGAVVGFLPGLVLLGTATLSPQTFDNPAGTGCERECVMTASLGLSVLGSAIGAFIGSAVKTERWERLPLPDR